jgi:DnaK suppressor protein
MDEARREQYEKRLRQERERARKAFEQLDDASRSGGQDDGELSTWPQHIADQGTDAYEQDKTLLLLSQEGRLLHEIDEALRRLHHEDGTTFGRCEECGRDIAGERLDVVPWARTCVDCQNAIEQASGDADEADPREASGEAGR